MDASRTKPNSNEKLIAHGYSGGEIFGSQGADRVPLPSWSAIDQKLISMKLRELALEARKQLHSVDRQIEYENQGNLNSGAAVYQKLQQRLEIARERPRLMYEVCCEVLEIQGFSRTPEFVRMAYTTVVRPFFSAFTGSTVAAFRTVRRRTGGLGGATELQLTALSQEMARIEDMWREKFEIEARELEHFAKRNATMLLTNPSAKAAGQSDSSSKKQRRSRLLKHDTVIFAALLMQLKGMQYCDYLHDRGLRPKWHDRGPTTYPQSYDRGGSWRKAVQDEKSRAKDRMDRYPDSELASALVRFLKDEFDHLSSLLQSRNSPNSRHASRRSHPLNTA